MGNISYRFYFFLPTLLQACGVENCKKQSTGPRQDLAHERYRAVEGEIFMVPCLGQEHPQVEVIWSRTGEEEKHLSFECGMTFIAKTQHSGRYTCSRNQSFYLQVLEKKSLGCFQPEDSVKHLLVNAGGKVPCPGLNCSDNTGVIWYKMKRKRLQAVSEQHRDSCEGSGWLHICQVSKSDSGVYFCDRHNTDNWTLRRAVNVTVVASLTPTPPTILYPDENSTKEVELGQPHTLECTIHFPMGTPSQEVQWYMNYNMEDTTPVQMKSQRLANETFPVVEVTQTAVINEVAPQHLDNTYTCVATNTIGSKNVTIRLKQRRKVNWPSLAQYPIGPLLLVAGLGIVVRVKWLELQLILRSHFQLGNNKAEKEFDVFLSFVWPRTSSQWAPGAQQEGSNLLNFEGCSTARGPLEALLPQVLEGEWGHRLCLLERDVLPGGAYTNDVVLAIQRSQMLVCVLSAEYLTNTDAVFILESGLQALLHKSTPKLLLIWTNKASAAQIQADPPLPILVRRALKVLPSLDWTSEKPGKRTGNFWRSLKKSLPSRRVRGNCQRRIQRFSLSV